MSNVLQKRIIQKRNQLNVIDSAELLYQYNEIQGKYDEKERNFTKVGRRECGVPIVTVALTFPVSPSG